MLARATTSQGKRVFPPLPSVPTATRRRARA
jgi:hypothetical protein